MDDVGLKAIFETQFNLFHVKTRSPLIMRRI